MENNTNFLKKAVRQTYMQTDIGDVFEIFYWKANPYDLFVSKSLGDARWFVIFLHIAFVFSIAGYFNYLGVVHRKKWLSFFRWWRGIAQTWLQTVWVMFDKSKVKK